MILHICKKSAWQQAQKTGAYCGDTLESEGFIHCSTSEQVVEVANSLFKGMKDLILLVIDESKVVSKIKTEDAGNGTLYPHIYGPLNLDAVTATADFPPAPNGNFILPGLQ
ncbi:MAG: DUF952 domain-containing protein [Nitrospiraceae bacterium]|nr:DUF952 domain-containing protein [Nitrospiraceae bacterium]